MEVNLNEYCLHHIASYLKPHDWMQMSQVCTLWKMATSKQWKTITELKYLGNDQYSAHYDLDETAKKATIISAMDAGKIVLCAAPFVNVLSSLCEYDSFDGSEPNYFRVGQYYYGAKNFKEANVLNLLAKKSTELTEINLTSPPKSDLVRPLFEKNNIIKLQCETDYDYNWYNDIPTHGIVELGLTFCGLDLSYYLSLMRFLFHERFPNLKKLSLLIEYEEEECLTELTNMSQIFPYVTGLKYLHLEIISFVRAHLDGFNTLFSDITNLSELEYLSLTLWAIGQFDNSELLLKLTKGCPKLRVLKLFNDIQVQGGDIKKLLALPHLEKFFYQANSFSKNGQNSFTCNDMPEMKQLLKLSIPVDSEDISGFVEAVGKMPRLEKLFIDCGFIEKDSEVVRLLCGVVEVATSRGKDVLISTDYDYETKKFSIKQLKIEESSNHQATEMFNQHRETLKVTLIGHLPGDLFEHVAAFVRNKLYGFNAFVIEDKK